MLEGGDENLCNTNDELWNAVSYEDVNTLTCTTIEKNSNMIYGRSFNNRYPC